MKTVLRYLLLVVALPVSMVVVLVLFLQGSAGNAAAICDPVHRPQDPNVGSKPSTQPTQPVQPRPSEKE